MEELTRTLLEKLQKYRGTEDEAFEDVFLFTLEMAVQDILNYCNLELNEFPTGLHLTAVRLASDLYDKATIAVSLGDEEAGDVTSLREGDFQIATETKSQIYNNLVSSNNAESINHHRASLMRYRKMLN